MAGGDALLGGPRAPSVGLEQGVVVVGLDEERIDAPEHFDDPRGDVAAIAHHADLAPAAAEDEADRLDGVVRHGEGLDGKAAKLEGGAAFKDLPRGSLDLLADDLARHRRGVDRDGEGFHEHPQPAHVITVLVGEQDGVERLGRDADEPEPADDLAGGKPGIHQHARAVGLDHRGVSPTPAAEHRKPHGADHAWTHRGVESRNRNAIIPIPVRRIRIIHRLRVALALVAFVVLAGVVGTLWWANHTGLPESWRGGIEEALAANGLHAEIASLRYLPMRGIEAGEVVIFSDASRSRVLGRLDQLILDVDRSKLSRGDFQIGRLELSGARVTLAVDPSDPESKALEVTDARGRVEFSGVRQVEISGASGMVGGVRLQTEAILKLYDPNSTGTPEDQERSRAERRRLLIAVIEALDHFELSDTAPPVLRLDIRGDLEEGDSLRAGIDLRAADLTSRELDIERLDLRGELRGRTLVLHHTEVETSAGRIDGKLEYELDDRSGRFEIRSDADLIALASSLQLPLPEPAPAFTAPPVIHAHGHLAEEEGAWKFRIIGDADLTGPSYGHLSADHLRTRFSSDGKRLLLEDLVLIEATRRLDARAFFDGERLHYEGRTDLPLAFWQNAMTIQPLSSILNDFTASEDAATAVDFRGMAHLGDPLDWWFKGSAEGSGLAFRGVPTRYAEVTMDLNADTLDFTGGEVDFDFTDYRLRRAHGGPTSGRIRVDRILYNHPERTIGIEGLEGVAWPAPVVRTFAADVADELEVYRFHRPPRLSAEGLIGIESGLPKQDLLVTFDCPAAASYEFLEKTLELEAPSGRVRVLPDRVEIASLDTGAFGGRIRGDFESRLGGPTQKLHGELDWTRLGLPEIARTYEFDQEPKGSITGRIDFEITGTEVAGLDGEGHIALEQGELFDVPMFGPLSPLISAVIGRRGAGFQEATDAFCTFQVENGVIATTDFLTTTPSLVFTGDGRADLPKETLDMTVRMNARGLLGVITLPLKPFYGLFQFRGSGPIQDPEWKNVMFTSPPDEQKDRLLDPPKARPIGEPEPNPPRARVVQPPSR